MTYDLIVVGGGIAGSVAALRAAELGLKVALLERGEGADYPCNTRFSGGILHIGFRDPKREVRELEAVIAEITDGLADPALARAVAQDAARLIDWLRGQGINFIRFNAQEAYRWCMAPPRAMVPGLDWKGRGPDVMLRRLGQKITAAGGEIVTGTRATDLVMEDGRCKGVRAERGGASSEMAAGAVVLADGGFQADAELFRKNIGPAFERVLQRGAATGRGDGLRMAVKAGAGTTDLGRFYGHLLNGDAVTNSKVWPYPEMDEIAASGIVIGPDGRRIVDEGEGGIAIANRLARLGDPGSASIIFDSAIWEGPGRSARIPANPQLERGGGTLFRADTLDGLARALNVPADALRESVTQYNRAIAAGEGGLLQPPRRTDVHRAWPIEKPPFMASRICVGITYTMGGISIDDHARVLRPDRSPIPGLFAAGTTTGGIEGSGRTGYVGGLTKSGVLGLRAGESAVKLVQSSDGAAIHA